MSDNKQERNLQDTQRQTDTDALRRLQGDMEAEPTTDTDAARRTERDTDTLLRDATPQPAPRSLGKGIMARIREKKALPEPIVGGPALALGLGVTAMLALPLLVALSLGILTAFGTGSALSGLALSIAGGTMFLYSLLMGLMSSAAQIVRNYPILFALLLLLPAAWYGLWRLGKTWARDA